MNLYCNRCTLYGEPRLEYRHHSAGKHLGAWCRACDSWIQWVPQDGAWPEEYEKQQAAMRNHPMHPETWTPEYAEQRREREFPI